MDGKFNILTLPISPSVNHYWLASGHRRFLSPAAKKFRYDVGQRVHEYLLLNSPKFPFLGRLEMKVDIFPANKRSFDIDNKMKGIGDSLAHAGVYLDDSQIDRLIITRRELDKPNGRVEIIITEILED